MTKRKFKNIYIDNLEDREKKAVLYCLVDFCFGYENRKKGKVLEEKLNINYKKISAIIIKLKKEYNIPIFNSNGYFIAIEEDLEEVQKRVSILKNKYKTLNNEKQILEQYFKNSKHKENLEDLIMKEF